MTASNSGGKQAWVVPIVVALIGAASTIIVALISNRAGQSAGQQQAFATAAIQQSTSIAQAASTQIVVTSPPLVITSPPVVVTNPPVTVVVTSPPIVITSPPVIVTATPEPPTTIPTPAPEVLYQADWSHGNGGWSGANDWKTVDGMLVSDGSLGPSIILAPSLPNNITNYAIEAEIQVIRSTNICGDYGIFFRGTDRTGYWGGIGGTYCTNGSSWVAVTAGGQYTPDKNWHKYRIEAKGNTYRLLIDDSVWVEATDNAYLKGTQIGLMEKYMVINIRSFKVFKL